MTEGTAKAPRSIHTARSQAGWHMGSIACIQSLVGRLIDSVQASNERMDFVQAGGCCDVCPWKRVQTICASATCAITRALTGAIKNDPSPLPLTVALRGLPTIFPSLFLAWIIFPQNFLNFVHSPFERIDLWHTN